jgi:hypothetical protein
MVAHLGNREAKKIDFKAKLGYIARAYLK